MLFLFYNIDEEIIQTQKYECFHDWINKLFSEENMVQNTVWNFKMWQGPPHKQSKTELNWIIL